MTPPTPTNPPEQEKPKTWILKGPVRLREGASEVSGFQGPDLNYGECVLVVEAAELEKALDLLEYWWRRRPMAATTTAHIAYLERDETRAFLRHHNRGGE